MGDQTQFSDDISALWGPDDAGRASTAPRPPAEASPAPAQGPARPRTEAEERLAALEQDIRRLLERVTAGLPTVLDPHQLDALWTELQFEMADTRRDVLAQLDRRLADADLRVQERLGAVEAELRQGVAPGAAAMEAREHEPVGRHQARTLRHELEREFAGALAALRAETADALGQRIAGLEVRIGERLDRMAWQLSVATDRMAALEQEHARLVEGRAELDATVARLDARVAPRLAEPAAGPDLADPVPTGNGQAPPAKPPTDTLRTLWGLPRSIRGS